MPRLIGLASLLLSAASTRSPTARVRYADPLCGHTREDAEVIRRL